MHCKNFTPIAADAADVYDSCEDLDDAASFYWSVRLVINLHYELSFQDVYIFNTEMRVSFGANVRHRCFDISHDGLITWRPVK